MVELVIDFIELDATAKLSHEPGDVDLVRKCILQTFKQYNWNMLRDVAQVEKGHDFRTVMRNVIIVIAVIVLSENAVFNNLSVMEELLCRGATKWS